MRALAIELLVEILISFIAYLKKTQCSSITSFMLAKKFYLVGKYFLGILWSNTFLRKSQIIKINFWYLVFCVDVLQKQNRWFFCWRKYRGGIHQFFLRSIQSTNPQKTAPLQWVKNGREFACCLFEEVKHFRDFGIISEG